MMGGNPLIISWTGKTKNKENIQQIKEETVSLKHLHQVMNHHWWYAPIPLSSAELAKLKNINKEYIQQIEEEKIFLKQLYQMMMGTNPLIISWTDPVDSNYKGINIFDGRCPVFSVFSSKTLSFYHSGVTQFAQLYLLLSWQISALFFCIFSASKLWRTNSVE